jgi:hypothetical protein
MSASPFPSPRRSQPYDGTMVMVVLTYGLLVLLAGVIVLAVLRAERR